MGRGADAAQRAVLACLWACSNHCAVNRRGRGGAQRKTVSLRSQWFEIRIHKVVEQPISELSSNNQITHFQKTRPTGSPPPDGPIPPAQFLPSFPPPFPAGCGQQLVLPSKNCSATKCPANPEKPEILNTSPKMRFEHWTAVCNCST